MDKTQRVSEEVLSQRPMEEKQALFVEVGGRIKLCEGCNESV